MNIELSDDWQLWPEYAVRSAGFPVQGLEAFGPGEDARLAEVARDGAFREAVAWQSRESLTRAVDKLAGGVKDSPSRQRRWTDVVASYWQRYCAKNDTIGFFGPLAWGSFGESDSVRSGALERERVVHFETWAMEAVGAADGVETPLPMCPFPERSLRPLLGDVGGLDRLEVARAAVAAAPRTGVAAALDQLDRTFEAVAGRSAARAEGDSGGGRTVAYLDCMRDLDMTLGPAVLEELRASLPPVLYASRWWCGKVFERGAALLGQIADGHAGPLAPLLGPLMGAGFGLWNQLDAEQAELQRRWAAVTSGERRAAEAFADWTPGLARVGLSLRRHPDRRRGRGRDRARRLPDGARGLPRRRQPARPGCVRPPPSRPGGAAAPDPRRDRAGRPPLPAAARRGRDDRAQLAAVPGGRRGGRRRRRARARRHAARRARGRDRRRRSSHRPRRHVQRAARGVPLPADLRRRAAQLRAGRAAGRPPRSDRPARRPPRDWSAPANELGADLAGWARERGLPRRVFARSPLERKPRYVDFESPALCRALRRFAAPAGEQPVEFTEMLPGPGECWLESDAGRHTSELRLVALGAR